MFKLRYGFLLTGITTGFILLATFFGSLPDGKLHLVFCNVGQGDGVYIRFPDGRDALVDGGPNSKIIGCLSRHMPFWDRHINMVLATHPQNDHIGGIPEVLRRYQVDYVVRSNVSTTSDIYKEFLGVIAQKKIAQKFATAGEHIAIGPASLSLLWPASEQVAKAAGNVLGASIGDLNDYSLVFWLRYGSFDALFTGDADMRVENKYRGSKLSVDGIEVLKVPHHGSKTGMSEAYIDWIKPKLAVISVGKNSYGHPAQKILTMLANKGVRVLRTDQEGDIEVVSDGKGWKVN